MPSNLDKIYMCGIWLVWWWWWTETQVVVVCLSPAVYVCLSWAIYFAAIWGGGGGGLACDPCIKNQMESTKYRIHSTSMKQRHAHMTWMMMYMKLAWEQRHTVHEKAHTLTHTGNVSFRRMSKVWLRNLFWYSFPAFFIIRWKTILTIYILNCVKVDFWALPNQPNLCCVQLFFFCEGAFIFRSHSLAILHKYLSIRSPLFSLPHSLAVYFCFHHWPIFITLTFNSHTHTHSVSIFSLVHELEHMFFIPYFEFAVKWN